MNEFRYEFEEVPSANQIVIGNFDPLKVTVVTYSRKVAEDIAHEAIGDDNVTLRLISVNHVR